MHHLNEVYGKFVQVTWAGQSWLLLASKDQHAFHNQILAHFLSDNHLPFHWQSPEVLEFDQPKLKIHGGGKFHLIWDEHRLTLFDNSMVYGRFDEAMLRQTLKQVAKPWSEFAITIE